MLAGIIQGEASNPADQFGVASTIFNRSQAGSFPGGSNPFSVATAPSQFSAFPNGMQTPTPFATQLAQSTIDGTLPSMGNTGNATYYNAAGFAYPSLSNNSYSPTSNAYSDAFQQPPSNNFQLPQLNNSANATPAFPSSNADLGFNTVGTQPAQTQQGQYTVGPTYYNPDTGQNEQIYTQTGGAIGQSNTESSQAPADPNAVQDATQDAPSPGPGTTGSAAFGDAAGTPSGPGTTGSNVYGGDDNIGALATGGDDNLGAEGGNINIGSTGAPSSIQSGDNPSPAPNPNANAMTTPLAIDQGTNAQAKDFTALVGSIQKASQTASQTSTADTASGESWFSGLFVRFGLILLGLVMVGVGLFLIVHGRLPNMPAIVAA